MLPTECKTNRSSTEATVIFRTKEYVLAKWVRKLHEVKLQYEAAAQNGSYAGCVALKHDINSIEEVIADINSLA